MLMYACAVYFLADQWEETGGGEKQLKYQVYCTGNQENHVFKAGGNFRSQRKNVTRDTNLFRRLRLMQDKRA